MTPDDATAFLRSAMPLADTLDMRATAAGPSEARVEIDWAPGLCTGNGVLHGGWKIFAPQDTTSRSSTIRTASRSRSLRIPTATRSSLLRSKV